MALTSAEMTILGLIIEQPRHGYDLEQLIEKRGIRAWTDIGFSSIYYILAKLEKRGLVGTDQRTPGAKSRRVFWATTQGRRIATESAAAFIAEPRTVPLPALAGMANLSLLAEPEYDAALRSRLAQLESRVATVRAAEESQAPLPRPAREVFSYSLNLLEAEISWLTTRIETSDE